MSTIDDDKIATFCSITDAGEDSALHYLEAAGGNVEVAVSLFLDEGQESNRPIDQSQSPSAVRAPIRPTRGVLVDTEYEGNQAGWIDPSMTILPGFLRPTAPTSPTYYLGANADSETGRRLASLYRPPYEIIFNGTFDQAKRHARDHFRYLVVSLHEPTEFGCQAMNRDVWKDQRVGELCREELLLWQVAVGSDEAAWFVRFYPIQSHPHTSLIDPRTGLRVLQWNRLLSPEEFIEQVLTFTGEHPLRLEEPVMDQEKSEKVESIIQNDHQQVGAKRGSPELQSSMNVNSADRKDSPKRDKRDHLPAEPEASDPGTTTIQFRLPDGSRMRRRFRLEDPISLLFVYTETVLTKGEFDLFSASVSLRGLSGSDSLASHNLRNVTLTVVLLREEEEE